MTIATPNRLVPTMRGTELPYEDDLPLESSWHLNVMYLLMSILGYFWRDRHDIYLGGNQFVYFDPKQSKKHHFRGPDFFLVKGVKDNHHRHSWVIWEEEFLTPNFVVELASETTADFDVTGKKAIYEQLLKTTEYVVYNPETNILQGWRLSGKHYVPIIPNENKWLWSEEIGLWLGVVEHRFLNYSNYVKALRFFDKAGQLVPTKEEAETQRAETQAQRAEVEAQARRAAEAEIARLTALLSQQD